MFPPWASCRAAAADTRSGRPGRSTHTPAGPAPWISEKYFPRRQKIFEELLKNISIITHLALVALAGGLIAHDAGFALVTGPALLLEVGDKLGAANKLT